jgi:hypothetical protein
VLRDGFLAMLHSEMKDSPLIENILVVVRYRRTRLQAFMEYMASRYTLKEGSVKDPDMSLGSQVKKLYIDGSDDP